MDAQTFTLTKAAQYLGFSRKTLYNMLDDGRFPVAPIPGTSPRRWNKDDLDAWRNGESGNQ
jgi:excisionase family DNA binding protein